MLLVDLDGVLADFVSGSCEVHGRPTSDVRTWDYFNEWGMTANQFWAPIKAMGYGFYREFVPPYPWLRDLQRLLDYSGHDFAIATANPKDAGLVASKREWIDKHLGNVPVITVESNGYLRAPQLKALLAGPGRILIDDSDDNIEAFRAAGGEAITFPQPWNKLHNMTAKRVEYVRDCLQLMKGQVA